MAAINIIMIKTPTLPSVLDLRAILIYKAETITGCKMQAGPMVVHAASRWKWWEGLDATIPYLSRRSVVIIVI